MTTTYKRHIKDHGSFTPWSEEVCDVNVGWVSLWLGYYGED